MSSVIDSIERDQLKKGLPPFEPGDRVRVHFQVIEGTRKRTQVFEGVVLRRQGSGARETFTVRKQSFGVGVERTFPLHSPKIEKLEVAARGDVRRAKLYYLRGRIGKAARVAERRWGIDEEMVSARPPPRRRPRSTPRASARRRSCRSRPRPRPRRRGRRAAEAAEEAPEAEATEAEAAAEPEASAEEARGRGRERGETEDSAAPASPRTRSRTRPVTPTRTPRAETSRCPKPKSKAGGLIELVVIVALALGLALAMQAWVVKPYQIPSGSMEPTLDIGQRVLVNRFIYHLEDPQAGDIVVFHPPAGAEARGRVRGDHARNLSPARSRPPHESSQNFIKRIVAGRRRHALDQRRAPGGERGGEDRRAVHQPCGSPAVCNMPKTITIPKGYFFMMGDNRGASDDSRFWGPVPKDWIVGEAFFTYWPAGPDRHPLGNRSSLSGPGSGPAEVAPAVNHREIPETEVESGRADRARRDRRPGVWAWPWRSRPGWSSPTRSPRARWNRRSTSASGSSSTASSTT